MNTVQFIVYAELLHHLTQSPYRDDDGGAHTQIFSDTQLLDLYNDTHKRYCQLRTHSSRRKRLYRELYTLETIMQMRNISY